MAEPPSFYASLLRDFDDSIVVDALIKVTGDFGYDDPEASTELLRRGTKEPLIKLVVALASRGMARKGEKCS